MTENRQVLIDSLPNGKLAESNYRMESAAAPTLQADGEVLCRTLVVTIGAGTRAGLQGSASYAGAPQTNIVMNGTGVARVEQSNSADFSVGDLVVCSTGWQDYSVQQANQLNKVQDDIDPAHYLGALGTNGLTAYFGLLAVGQPKEGETVLVSAGAGSVGHLVSQMARIKGCQAVGITSTSREVSAVARQDGVSCVSVLQVRGFSFSIKRSMPQWCRCLFRQHGRRYSWHVSSTNEYPWPNCLLWRSVSIRHQQSSRWSKRYSRLVSQ